jgi:hypothetical protein
MSLKEKYLLPNMDLLLQRVTGSQMLSMLDGFSSHNQVLIANGDKHKTAFTTLGHIFLCSYTFQTH